MAGLCFSAGIPHSRIGLVHSLLKVTGASGSLSQLPLMKSDFANISEKFLLGIRFINDYDEKAGEIP